MKNVQENFEIHIKTFAGLEEILAKETLKLGGQDVVSKKRAVVCKGDLGFLYKANFSLRTAVKILVPVYKFKAESEDFFYNKLLQIHWEDFLDISQTFKIESTVHSEQFTHSQFMALKMKDAIVDYFRKKYSNRPSVNQAKPDVIFHLHIDDNFITISLDSSGESLFKRGYRELTGKAPLNEVLASGMLQLAQWDGKGNFLDPMCGSGTLLIEATLIALNLPPQLVRQDFGFMNWNNYDKTLWERIKETRLNKVTDFDGKIIGYDDSVEALLHAKKNIEKMGFEEFITLKKQNFFTSEKEVSPLLIVFNPPYDERLPIEHNDFYKKMGDTLKSNYPNTLSWFISSDLAAEKKVGLRPSRRIKLFNGKLECKFLQFEVYEGSKKQKFSKN